MRNISEIKSNPHLSNITLYDEAQKAGYGVIHLVRWKGTVIFDSTSTPWEHVSVSPKKKGIFPTWYELKLIKEIFWQDDEEVIQFFPRKAEHVNVMTNCLHLWRNPDVEALCNSIEGRGV